MLAAVSASLPVILTVADQCDDSSTRPRLNALARICSERVVLCLERLTDEDVIPLFAWADVVALPYQSITTSGFVMVVPGYGRPLLVPKLEAFVHLAREAIVGYSGPGSALTATLGHVAADGGPAYATTLSWSEIAMWLKAK